MRNLGYCSLRNLVYTDVYGIEKLRAGLIPIFVGHFQLTQTAIMRYITFREANAVNSVPCVDLATQVFASLLCQ